MQKSRGRISALSSYCQLWDIQFLLLLDDINYKKCWILYELEVDKMIRDVVYTIAVGMLLAGSV